MPGFREFRFLAGKMWRGLVAVGCVMIPWAPSQAQDRTFEQASTAFIQRYVKEWSGPAPAALAYMDQVYPDQVEFYGKALTHPALMDLKRKYAARWPERSLSVRPGTIQVSCDPNHLCTVQATFDWRYRSPERQAVSSGSASLKLALLDGMTILAESGAVLPQDGTAATALVQRASIPPVAAQPAFPQGEHPAPVAETHPQRGEAGRPQEDFAPQRPDSNPQRDAIAELRNAYFAHGSDKDWITAWLAQKRDFSGRATFVGTTEDQAGPGPSGVLRTEGFLSDAGTIACLNPDDATPLKVGEKVSIHGVITIFIEDVMYLGQCSVQPG